MTTDVMFYLCNRLRCKNCHADCIITTNPNYALRNAKGEIVKQSTRFSEVEKFYVNFIFKGGMCS